MLSSSVTRRIKLLEARQIQGLAHLQGVVRAGQQQEEAANNVDEFISFGDDDTCDVQQRPEANQHAVQSLPASSSGLHTPWGQASHRIRSPLIRLHNGRPLFIITQVMGKTSAYSTMC